MVKRYHTEEQMRAAVKFLHDGRALDSLKKGEDNPATVLDEVIDEVLERRAVWEDFKNTIQRWAHLFNAR